MESRFLKIIFCSVMWGGSAFLVAFNKSSLTFVARRGDVEALKELLAQGADPNAFFGSFCPLHIACIHKQHGVIKELLKSPKIQVDLLDTSGRTPLWIASEFADMRTIKLLLNKDANPNTENPQSPYRYPLIFAAATDKITVVQALLESESSYSLDVNVEDVTGKTALDYAIENENDELRNTLWRAGAIAMKHPTETPIFLLPENLFVPEYSYSLPRVAIEEQGVNLFSRLSLEETRREPTEPMIIEEIE